MLICMKCGTVGEGKMFTPGTMFCELVLWLAFLLPGLIYSVWRLSSKKRVCASCGSAELIPLDSPSGQKLHKEFGEPKLYTPPPETAVTF